MALSVVTNLKRPTYFLIMIGSAFLVFDLFYFLMSNLPGTRNNMCVMGANFTVENILFSFLLALLAGTMISGFIALYRQKKAKKLLTTSTSGVGFVIGSLTVFCTICTIPVFTLFGLSISLSIFSAYEGWFKTASIILMLLALYKLNKQLDNDCGCEIKYS